MSQDRTGLARRVTVTVTYVVCVLGSMVGVGVFGGTPIAEAAGGLLSADATHLAPASSAFSVWTVIYVALGAYTVWQWWERTDPRRTGWPGGVAGPRNGPTSVAGEARTGALTCGRG